MSKASNSPEQLPFFEQPWLGTTLTALAALLFFFLLQILPLVGPSGVDTPHYQQNFLTFLGVLVVALAFAALGLASKLKRRNDDQSPFPYVSAILVGVYVLMAVCLFTGLFAI